LVTVAIIPILSASARSIPHSSPSSPRSETEPELRRHAPRFGEHTREVLKEAGYSDAQIEAMAKSGAARL
jgi:crotonobetainyl-CoA:carnitine CoA-transferase CaiB-like acyl-CoA transferase